MLYVLSIWLRDTCTKCSCLATLTLAHNNKTIYLPKITPLRAFVNTRLLVHKHVKISVDKWILETTRPQKHVKFLEQYIL